MDLSRSQSRSNRDRDWAAAIAARRDELIRLRREVHANPELAFQERWTAQLVADSLTKAGLEVTTGLAETGVVGLLEGGRPGKTILVRADMDALPLHEQSDAPYRSQNEGVAHACGHDGHVAVALTVASVLASYRQELPGQVKFVFQPAEEVAGGAQRLIAAGVLQNPSVDAALALHMWNDLPVGKVGVRPGPTFASADELEIIIKGKGGHGAQPQQAVDAIAVAGQVITALQNLVSREVSPFQTAVLTVGTIHGGSAFNIIADEVRMTGTLRTFDLDLRERLLERIEGIIEGITSALRAEYEFRCGFSAPPVVNDAAMTELVRKAAAAVVGQENVVTIEPSTGGDDMAHFLNAVPGCYFVIGSANPARGLDKPHHHPAFDFDEDALPVAAQVLAQAIVDYLRG